MKYREYRNAMQENAEYQEAEEGLKLHFALANAVILARIQIGWSQSELARRVGTKQANISRIESGLGNPTLVLIQKILSVLDLELSIAPRQPSTSYKSIRLEGSAIPVEDWPGIAQTASTMVRDTSGEYKI